MSKFEDIASSIGLVGLLIHGCLTLLFGGMFLFISLYFYISDEREAAHNYYLKDFAKNNYVETDADSILPENEGKLVLVHGQTSTEDFITDSVFNVSVDKSMCLNRNVQMYQWAETTHKYTTGSGKNRHTHYSYSYAKGWHRDTINSNRFHDGKNHKNPSFEMVLSEKKQAQNIKVGAFKIISDKVCSLSSEQTVFIKPDNIKIPINTAFLKGNHILYNIYDEINIKNKLNTSLNSSDVTPKEDNKNQVDEKSPKIGDIRISFTKNPVCTVTVLAKQNGESLVPYKTKNLEIFEAGLNTISVDNLFNFKKENNNSNKILIYFFIFIGMNIIANINKPNKKNNYKGCFLSLAISFILVTGITGFIWFPYSHSYAIRSLGLTIIGILFTVIILAFSYFKNSNLNKNINNNRIYNNRNYNNRNYTNRNYNNINNNRNYNNKNYN